MCMHGALCSILNNLKCNITTFTKNVLTFDPTPGVKGVCKDRIIACKSLHSSFLYFYIQHDHVLKGRNFDLYTPSPGLGGCYGKIFPTMLMFASSSFI